MSKRGSWTHSRRGNERRRDSGRERERWLEGERGRETHSLTKESKLYLPNRPFDASHNGSFTTTGQFRKTDRFRKTDQSPQRVSSVKRISATTAHITKSRMFFTGSTFLNGSAKAIHISPIENVFLLSSIPHDTTAPLRKQRCNLRAAKGSFEQVLGPYSTCRIEKRYSPRAAK